MTTNRTYGQIMREYRAEQEALKERDKASLLWLVIGVSLFWVLLFVTLAGWWSGL